MTQKEEKQKAIDDLTKEQVKLLKKSLAIAKLPQPKKASTVINRAFRVVGYALLVHALHTQKMIIRSKPIKPTGINLGNAMLCEHDEEFIKDFKDGKLVKLKKTNTNH